MKFTMPSLTMLQAHFSFDDYVALPLWTLIFSSQVMNELHATWQPSNQYLVLCSRASSNWATDGVQSITRPLLDGAIQQWISYSLIFLCKNSFTTPKYLHKITKCFFNVWPICGAWHHQKLVPNQRLIASCQLELCSICWIIQQLFSDNQTNEASTLYMS